MIKDNKDLDIAIKAVKAAGKILKKNFGKEFRVIRKTLKEMVSEVDIKSQQAIVDILQSYNPIYEILTEEKRDFKKKKGKHWIIDPIDGTHNYIAGLPFSGISIALVDDDSFDLGVIYFPMENELCYAIKGKGAYYNKIPISVSKNRELSKAIVNYDNQFYLSDKSFAYYKALTEKAFTTRIFGVAIKDICLIASGKIDGRVWNNTKICDIAAGIVILTESGGRITNFDGTPCTLDSTNVIASNGHIHQQLLEIFKKEVN